MGVFSERDLLNRVVVLKHDPTTLKLGDVTSPLRAVIRCDETPIRLWNAWTRLAAGTYPWSMAKSGWACFRCVTCCALN